MRVFNLTTKTVDYRGKNIGPNGSFEDYPDMTFIPDRDKALEGQRVLSFGKLPYWWEAEKALQSVGLKSAPPPVKPRAKPSSAFSSAKKVVEPSSAWVEKPIIQKTRE
jgi:hypothetical protein